VNDPTFVASRERMFLVSIATLDINNRISHPQGP